MIYILSLYEDDFMLDVATSRNELHFQHIGGFNKPGRIRRHETWMFVVLISHFEPFGDLLAQAQLGNEMVIRSSTNLSMSLRHG